MLSTLVMKPQDSVGRIGQRALSCGSRGGKRWFCVWCHPGEERKALHSIARAGFEAYLPLHVERDIHRHSRIVPLFPRYCFVRFDAAIDAWGAIRSCRGVGDLIRHEPGSPTPLPDSAIDELLERTSRRGIVDDPGDASRVALAGGRKQLWQGITALSAEDRSRLLVRLFGEGVA
jgi:transcriptional antiterminator RfaH